jgi:anti-sigma regulatory factor (Ser/Thr protein kinase)
VVLRQEYPSDLHQLPALRAFVRSACREAWSAERSEEALTLLDLAVGEVGSNIILHAYKGEKGPPIELVVDTDPDRVCVSFYHGGEDFDPSSARPPAFDGSRESGFGLYLVGQAVDEVRYGRDDRGRSAIHLFKSRT